MVAVLSGVKAIRRDIAVVILLILALGGLIVFQVRLLRTGLNAEKMTFDRAVQLALQDVRRDLNEPNPLSQQIVVAGQIADLPFPSVVGRMDSVVYRTGALLQDHIRARLARRGVFLDFEYAITSENITRIFLASPSFRGTEFRFWYYDIPLDGYTQSMCGCPQYLHLNVSDLVSYLFKQLSSIIWPSLVFLTVIFACFGYLFYTLNRQRRLQRAQTDFINNLTHELKTPVFSISLATKILREKFAAPDAERYFNLLDRENKKLRGHIDRVLELANLEKTRYQLSREPMNPNDVLRALADNYELKIQDREGTFHADLQTFDGTVSLDRNHFRGAVENLLENALKYSEGAPQVTLRSRFAPDHFVVEVQDRGIGIPTSEQRSIFQKFYRVNRGDRHDVKGFGLGLPYVQQIAEAHGGTVQVQSREGIGSTFTLRLPSVLSRSSVSTTDM